ncbi:hypothetical protein Syun_011338 [Stephania yunnanensis]|uniref:IST1-like protein n=1 Tax=Stephania yunnanensis TaxID=152371 RepID=A0AAP0PEB2_9MAGN
MSKILHRSFKPAKCKTSLKLAVARIKLLKNKGEVRLKQMRKELAQLLEAGQDRTARIRVEHLVREEKTMAAYDLIEIYCELIAVRLPIIESQKNCPIDLKEAIASVVFASPRCSDIPELSDIHKHLTAKYGKEFIATALELRPDCGVSRMMVEKLSTRAPDVETKIRLLTAIAKEHNVKWDPEQVTENELKPPEDLLDGSKTTKAASNIPAVDPTVQLPHRHGPNYESSASVANAVSSSRNSQNVEPTGDAMRSSFSKPRTTVHSAEGTVFGHSSSKEDSAFSSKTQNWGMEFKDATSAAQAAAESAERATIAAKAAAEFANIGRIIQESSAGPQGSFVNHYRENEVQSLVGAVSKAEHTEQTVRKDNFLRTSSHDMDRRTADDFEHKSDTESRTSTSDVDTITERRASHLTQSRNKDDYSDDEILDSNSQNHDAYPQRSSFEVNTSKSNWQFSDEIQNDVMLNSNHDTDGSDSADHSSGIIQFNFQEGTKQPSFNNYSAAVFDDYGSDDDLHLVSEGVFNRSGWDSYGPSEDQKSSASAHFSENARSPRREGHGSFKRASEHSYFAAEHFSPFEVSESKEDTSFPSQSSELPATFDDSDGLYSGSDEEAKDVNVARRTDLGSVPLEVSGLASSPESLQIDRVHGATRIDSKKQEPTYDKLENPDLQTTNNLEANINVRGPIQDKHEHFQSSSSLQAEEVKEAYDFGREISSNSFPSLVLQEATSSLQSSKVSLMNEYKVKDEGNGQGVPDNMTVGSESLQGLNFGKLRGGFRNKGNIRPPYNKGPSWDSSSQSRFQSDEGVSATIEKPTAKLLSRTSMNSEVLNEAPNYQKQIQVQHEASSRSPKTFFYSDSDDETEVSSYQTAASPSYARYGLSQRTRDSPKMSGANVRSRFKGRSELPSSDEKSNSPKLGSYSKSVLRPEIESIRDGSSKEPSLTSSTAEEHSMPQKSHVRKVQNSKLSTADVSVGQKTIKAQPRNEANVHREVSELPQPSAAVKQQSTPLSSATSRDTGTSKSPSLDVGSRENSLKKASHVHPKLPDYDSFAAHFESLRSNRRSG